MPDKPKKVPIPYSNLVVGKCMQQSACVVQWCVVHQQDRLSEARVGRCALAG